MKPCRPCEARRRMLAEAKARDGIKGVVKALPSVGRHLMQNLPKPILSVVKPERRGN